MDNSHALVFDRSTPFTTRLQRILQELGYDIAVINGRKALLRSVESDNPSIIFVAVDQPREIGFSLFTEIKRATKQIPIVLVTGSVPAGEMRIHQSLQVHADAYLDKRHLSDLEIFTTLNRLLSLGLSVSELERLADITCGDGFFSPSLHGEGSLEAEIERRVSWDDERGMDPAEPAAITGGIDPSFIERPATDGDLESPSDLGESCTVEQTRALQAEVERLKGEIETMQCAVSSSPFSDEYRALKSRVDKAEEGATSLRRQLADQARHIRDLEGKLIDAEFQVRTLQDSLASEQEQVRSLERQLAHAVQERVTVEHEWAESMDDLKARSEQDRLNAVKNATEKGRQDMAAFQRDHSESLEKLSERSRQEFTNEIEARDASWRAKLAQLEKEHADALEYLKREKEQVVGDLTAAHAKMISLKEQEFKDAFTRAATAHENDLAACSGQWMDRLKQGQEEFDSRRIADCAALEARYRKELQELRSHHSRERERLQEIHAEGLENLSVKLRHKIPDPGQIKNPLLRAKLEEKLMEREAALAAATKGSGEETGQAENPLPSAKLEEEPRTREASLAAAVNGSSEEIEQIKNPLLRAKLEEKLREREADLAAAMKGPDEES
jgi:CheY-like chemotaxis protein